MKLVHADNHSSLKFVFGFDKRKIFHLHHPQFEFWTFCAFVPLKSLNICRCNKYWQRLGINMGKATGSAAVTMAAGVVGGVAGGAVAGAVLGAVGSAAGRAAQGRKVDIGDAVAGGAMGLLGAGKGGMGRK